MSDGKIIDKWYWRREDEETVEIPVRLVKRTDQLDRDVTGNRRSPPYHLEGSHLHVCMKEPVKIDIEATDVEILRKAVFAELEEFYDIKWERYYLVQVRPERPYEGLGAGFCLSYKDIEKGTTWDNQELLRQWRHRGYDVSAWPGEFKDENGRVQACIPATKVNQEGLHEFCDRLHTLRVTIADFLKPDVIEKHLANLAGLKILPEPDLNKIEEYDSGGKKKRRRRRG